MPGAGIHFHAENLNDLGPVFEAESRGWGARASPGPMLDDCNQVVRDHRTYALWPGGVRASTEGSNPRAFASASGLR